jgi:hypothetical protein
MESEFRLLARVEDLLKVTGSAGENSKTSTFNVG